MARAWFALALGLAVGGAPAPAPPPPAIVTVPPHPAWLQCRRDADCAATYLSCHGWIAANRHHLDEVQRWYSEANAGVLALVECSGPTAPAPATTCRARACAIADRPAPAR